jgi:hypothetical protein
MFGDSANTMNANMCSLYADEYRALDPAAMAAQRVQAVRPTQQWTGHGGGGDAPTTVNRDAYPAYDEQLLKVCAAATKCIHV